MASDFISAMTIAATLEELQADQLSAIYKAYGHRIRVNPKRHQIIITGTECDENAPGAILNVKQETWARLRALGAMTWEPKTAL
jgi:hypothetical protein